MATSEVGRILLRAVSERTAHTLRSDEVEPHLDDLIGRSRLHRVTGPLAWAFRSSGLDVPDVMQQYEVRLAMHRMRSMSDLAWVGEVFDSAGVEWLAFKGPVLTHLAYQDRMERIAGDLDLLVRREQLRTAVDALVGAGAKWLDLNWEVMVGRLIGETHFLLPGGTALDLHWHLLVNSDLRSYFKPDHDRLFDEARADELDGVPVRTFDPASTLVYSCLHGAISGGHRLVWLKDIEQLLLHDLDEHKSAGVVARDWQCELVMTAMVRRAERALGVTSPITADLDAPRLLDRAMAWLDRRSPVVDQESEESLLRLGTRSISQDGRSTALRFVGRSLSFGRRRLAHEPHEDLLLAKETGDPALQQRYFDLVDSAMRRTVTVGLLWHSVGSSNLGVVALTESNLALIRSVAARCNVDVRLIAIGWVDNGSTGQLPPLLEVVELRLIDFLPLVGKLHRACGRCDVVVDISAGDSFTDIYGRHRFLTQTLSKLTVRLTGRRLVLAPQTIGPFRSRPTRWLAARAMSAAHVIVTRDRESAELVRELTGRTDVIESTDVAIELPFEPRRCDAPSTERVRVGLNISGLLVSDGHSGANKFGLAFDYPTFIHEVLDRYSGRSDLDIWLVPHLIAPGHPVEDDVEACASFAEQYPGVSSAPAFSGPVAAKEFIATCDAFVGARMHSCIAAFSSGVPVLPVAYSRKFDGMFGSLGYPHLIDARHDDQAEALEKLEWFLANLDLVAGDVVEAVARGHKLLDRYRAVLEHELVRAAGGSERT